MTLTPLNAIRERSEAIRSAAFGMSFTTPEKRDADLSTLVRELLDTQERLIRALESAVDQRNDNFADMEDSGIITTKQGQVFRAQDNAALAAILEPKVTP